MEGPIVTAANGDDEAAKALREDRGCGRKPKDPSLGLLNIRGGDTLSASNCNPITVDMPPSALDGAARLLRWSRSDATCAHWGVVAVEVKRSFRRHNATIACWNGVCSEATGRARWGSSKAKGGASGPPISTWGVWFNSAKDKEVCNEWSRGSAEGGIL